MEIRRVSGKRPMRRLLTAGVAAGGCAVDRAAAYLAVALAAERICI